MHTYILMYKRVIDIAQGGRKVIKNSTPQQHRGNYVRTSAHDTRTKIALHSPLRETFAYRNVQWRNLMAQGVKIPTAHSTITHLRARKRSHELPLLMYFKRLRSRSRIGNVYTAQLFYVETTFKM